MASLANKDEAEKCRDMAKGFLARGEREKAVRFFEKSLRLYPLPDVEKMRDAAKIGGDRGEAGSSSARSSSATAGASERPAGKSAPSSTNGNRNGSGGHESSRGHGSGMNGSGDREGKRGGAAPGVRRRSATASAASAGGAGDGRSSGVGGGGGGGGSGGSGADSTGEQACKKVLAAKPKGHYAVLGVEKDATEDQIKKAYRKLALKFHPDKNSAPSAHAAFQAIGTAFAVLSDPEKREHYNRFGDDDGPQGPGGSGGAGPFGRPFGHTRYAQEVSPEDIFNMFFGVPPGGGAGGGGTRGQRGGSPFRVYRAGGGVRGGGGGRQEGGGAGPMALLQMLPVILIMLYSLFGSTQQETLYSMSETTRHPTRRVTKAHRGVVEGINYFVTPKFRQTHARDHNVLRKVEASVTERYRDKLRSECRDSQFRKSMRVEEAKRLRRSVGPDMYDELLREADATPLPACEELIAKFGSWRTYT